jgi:hypothetical protein
MAATATAMAAAAAAVAMCGLRQHPKRSVWWWRVPLCTTFERVCEGLLVVHKQRGAAGERPSVGTSGKGCDFCVCASSRFVRRAGVGVHVSVCVCARVRASLRIYTM